MFLDKIVDAFIWKIAIQIRIYYGKFRLQLIRVILVFAVKYIKTIIFISVGVHNINSHFRLVNMLMTFQVFVLCNS